MPKIKNVKHIGKRQTFNIEMKSDFHNYITTPNSTIIHKNSHAIAYSLLTLRSLWCKAYFPEEWVSAVCTYCNSDKLIRYMNHARSDGVQFEPMNIDKLSLNYRAIAKGDREKHTDDKTAIVVPGLISIKGIGKNAYSYIKDGHYTSLDDFIEKLGKNKTIIERLIKLGSFKSLHKNARATYIWYQYKYCTGKDITELKKTIHDQLLDLEGWNEKTIAEHKKKLIEEFKTQYPKRNKIPDKITKWKPKPVVTIEKIEKLYPDDYTIKEILEFEKEYLGYTLHSPLELYHTSGNRTIKEAKYHGEMECVVQSFTKSKTKTMADMGRLVVTDGKDTAKIMIWSNSLQLLDRNLLKEGRGLLLLVEYDHIRDNFTLQERTTPIVLKKKDL